MTKSSPVVFANYSLVEEEERVSHIAAVQSEESLLFVVGNKVPSLCFCLSLPVVTLVFLTQVERHNTLFCILIVVDAD